MNSSVFSAGKAAESSHRSTYRAAVHRNTTSTPETTDAESKIVETEGVLGGKPRLDDHRSSVLEVTELLDTGHSIAETADQLDSMREELRTASRYYRHHRREMAEYEDRRDEIYRRNRDSSRAPSP